MYVGNWYLHIYFFFHAEAPPTRYNSRRKSVFAETYNPEEDEEEEGPNVYFNQSLPA